MSTVRVSPGDVGRLVRVLLTDVNLDRRRAASARLRGMLWRQHMDPRRFDVPPTLDERWTALRASIAIERAAVAPSATPYALSEACVRAFAPEALDD